MSIFLLETNVAYCSGTVDDFYKVMEDWRTNTITQQMVYSFDQGEFVHNGKLQVKDVIAFQLELSSPDIPNDVVICMKYMSSNPKTNLLNSWNHDVVKKDGYYYVVGLRTITNII